MLRKSKSPRKAQTAGKKQSGLKSLIELLLTVAIAVGLALLIQAFVVKPYRIPSPSMVPTLEIGQRVLTNRLDTSPSLGDVVVFHPPAGADPATPVCGSPNQGSGHPQACAIPTAQESTQTFIKRVVGLPGDHLKVIEGSVYINGKRQDEPFARLDPGCPTCNLTREITIPKGEYYMMGDNRGESADSREWGPVPKKWIIGKAFMTYWPPGRIGLL